MTFAEELLKQAFLLLNKESKNPTQASLRRSVSTAYYALFHLLISVFLSTVSVSRATHFPASRDAPGLFP